MSEPGLLPRVFANEWGRIVASLVRVTGDWALAEDCAQDAFAAAAAAWPRDGEPRNPGAWLQAVARNRALDRLRRRATESRALEEATLMQTLETPGGREPDGVPDDRLRLIFTCCHPAIALESRVALTLRTLCGLTVEEIAHAFGVGDAAMAKRLVRARQKIERAHIPFEVPSGRALPPRLGGVLAVLYLLFSEGYAPSGGDAVVRGELADEAIRLTRVLTGLLPDGEAFGLLALELFHDSRRAARTDVAGALVPLDEQDRTLWDRGRIEEGAAVLRRAGDGPYAAQARIAHEHARAATPALVDWPAVVRLYDGLLAAQPSPYAGLARAIALGMADGTDAGLAALAALRESGALAGDHYLAAAEADLLRRAGRAPAAAAAYRSALEAVRSDAERAYLERRLREVTTGGPA